MTIRALVMTGRIWSSVKYFLECRSNKFFNWIVGQKLTSFTFRMIPEGFERNFFLFRLKVFIQLNKIRTEFVLTIFFIRILLKSFEMRSKTNFHQRFWNKKEIVRWTLSASLRKFPQFLGKKITKITEKRSIEDRLKNINNLLWLNKFSIFRTFRVQWAIC